jgi:hypothetical protein
VEPLADQGNVDAQVRLGIIYRNGWGVPVDYVIALSNPQPNQPDEPRTGPLTGVGNGAC